MPSILKLDSEAVISKKEIARLGWEFCLKVKWPGVGRYKRKTKEKLNDPRLPESMDTRNTTD